MFPKLLLFLHWAFWCHLGKSDSFVSKMRQTWFKHSHNAQTMQMQHLYYALCQFGLKSEGQWIIIIIILHVYVWLSMCTYRGQTGEGEWGDCSGENILTSHRSDPEQVRRLHFLFRRLVHTCQNVLKCDFFLKVQIRIHIMSQPMGFLMKRLPKS